MAVGTLSGPRKLQSLHRAEYFIASTSCGGGLKPLSSPQLTAPRSAANSKSFQHSTNVRPRWMYTASVHMWKFQRGSVAGRQVDDVTNPGPPVHRCLRGGRLTAHSNGPSRHSGVASRDSPSGAVIKPLPGSPGSPSSPPVRAPPQPPVPSFCPTFSNPVGPC